MKEGKVPGLFFEFEGINSDDVKYLAVDRYRDFREVFLGSDRGRRVLSEIINKFCHRNASSVALAGADPYKTQFAEGERNVAIKIMLTLQNEPQEMPTRQVSVDPDKEK